ncbi:MAG TPA: 2-C-methyl-D-erythritol 2,4-cyclodiphosphate synthase [Spirochaetales bacterium]|nr:2-C-methyl-D-erythritol 2,4-cyclodiphosphate synthase [Spirochaetales bacterium]
MSYFPSASSSLILFRIALSIWGASTSSAYRWQAIQSAILGALAKGDIGFHFPDTHPAYKDADSQQLLRQVIQQELPPHSIENLAKLMNLTIEQVSVKAKTAEGMLNEVGSGGAVIAQATVLITQ